MAKKSGLFAVLFLVSWGCGDAQAPGVAAVRAEVVSSHDGVSGTTEVAVLPDPGKPGPGAEVDDDDPDSAGCPGCSFTPCAENADCISGYCVEGPIGPECAQLCAQDCPTGYVCRGVSFGSDPVFMCVYTNIQYCMPCDSDKDCAHPLAGSSKAKCLGRDDGSGSYCAPSCGETPDCPNGATCESSGDAAVGTTGYCRPEADVECGCSAYATTVSAFTTCQAKNEAGVCSGERVCTSDGLSDCDAATPAAETCNGFDDDCDGQTDEEVATAGDPCDGADSDECADGKWICNGAGLVCDDGEASATETCNGIDDDCDGLTDASDGDLPSVPCGLGVGACLGAISPSAACDGGGWLACEDTVYLALGLGYEPLQEATCDGLDNDCDGQTDEDVPTTGDDCDGPDPDDCPDGTWLCTKEGLVCDDGPGSGVEVCNGKDDDCDGHTDGDDEGLETIPCPLVVGACAGAVRPAGACIGGEWAACSTEVYVALGGGYQAGSESACDGVDNDCDGQKDDDFTAALPDGSSAQGIGQACGVGACLGGVTACATAGSIACSTAGSAQPEVCNGKDDDCDGLVDADDPSLLLPLCENQAGVCAGASKSAALCVNGSFQPCPTSTYGEYSVLYAAAGEPACNGVDEDCDGTVDEDFATTTLNGATINGVGAACGTGLCAGGLAACRADGQGIECPTEVAASTEYCNGSDDDCDGLLDAQDDSLTLPTCELQFGACAGSHKPATLCKTASFGTCTTGIYADHSASFESGEEIRCDSIDNDCDGETDEDFQVLLLDGTLVTGAGRACGAGACTDGSTVCDETGFGLTCSSEAGAGDEVCNGVDDDCDGATDALDSQVTLTPCERQQGVCAGSRHSRYQCEIGEFGACDGSNYSAHSAAFDGDAEARCDASDNDCDGETDEDFTLPMANGSTVVGSNVACGVGACAGGKTACAPGGAGIVCSTAALASAEVCNGLDDDCDGLTDSADPSLEPMLCEKQAGACAGAVHPPTACTGGEWSACGDAIYAATSLAFQSGLELSCDAIDNDCDGGTDEEFSVQTADGAVVVGPGKACGKGACSGGVTVCALTTLVCSSAGNATAETCNDRDDDCDGLLNAADPSMALVACEKQGGVCAGAMKPAALCTDGEWGPCGSAQYQGVSTAYQPGTEVSCDGQDNDCDAQIDEDFGLTLLDGTLVLGVGTACGTGACGGGKTACASDKLAITCPAQQASTPETCNGKDDDCDGKTDVADTSLVTVPCELQTGVCGALQKPKNLCVGGEWQTCDSSEYGAGWQPGAETSCDGKDNDCSGQTDEDFAVTTVDGATAVGVGATCGAGECAGGKTICAPGGGATLCNSSGNATSEICDNKDNDCDGLKDTLDSSLVRPACDKQSGVCAGSVKPTSLCGGVTGWGACTNAMYLAHSAAYTSPAETRCDGVDEDCDGTVDDDFTYTSPGGPTVTGLGKSCGQGACTGGVTLCNAAKTGLVCSTDGGAGSEICDGQDNDCDSFVDTADPSLALPLCELQAGVCAGARKPAALCNVTWAACGATQYLAVSGLYQAGVETTCDGQDNDCDSKIDDDIGMTQLNGVVVKGIGASCGVGICSGGVTSCNGGSATKCSTEVNASPEVCDGKDNDCDGLTDALDPSLVLAACEKTAGVCATSLHTAALCTDGTWKPCTAAIYGAVSGGAYQDGSETGCDQKDNDCDGTADEDFTLTQLNDVSVSGVGTNCGAGLCSGSKTACNATKTGITCPGESAAVTETCDGSDNDCDGKTDALDPSLQSVACEKTAGVCAGSKKPSALCVSSTWQSCTTATYTAHSSLYEVTETLCDQKDNDCTLGVDVIASPPGNSNQTGSCAGTKQKCTVGGFVDDYSSVPLYGIYEEPNTSYLDENCDGIDGSVAHAVFVAKTGVNNSTCSKASPCLTIQQALTVATTLSRTDVYIQASATAYTGPVTMVTGKRLYGGYTSTWARGAYTTAANEATIQAAAPASGFGAGQLMAIIARGVTGVVVDNLRLKGAAGADGAAGASGQSTYVVHVSNGANLTVRKCSVLQADAGDGGAGPAGVNVSTTGTTGTQGGPADEYSTFCSDNDYGGGGPKGQNTSCTGSTAGGDGGRGGTMDSNCPTSFSATPGIAGGSGSGGASGGTAGATCTVGGDGSPGAVSNGTAGAGGVVRGNVSSEFWVPGAGAAGLLGNHGGGGGGGGGSGGCDAGIDSYGAGGGGGGAGGCRATDSGDGGGAGGGTFGIFVVSSTATISNVAITRGVAGNGGAGGKAGQGAGGRAGGPGGLGDGDSQPGGIGGAGAHGGHTGGGGGGAGGHSIGIFSQASTVTTTGGSNSGGAAGTAGSGGPRPDGQADGNPGNPGASGLNQTTRSCTNSATDC